jgi:sulfoxide reductase heme-binding subunit YedZ
MTMWFLARGLGIVALVAFTIAVVLGATSSDRSAYRPEGLTGVRARDAALDRRVLLQLLHRSAAVVGLGALLLHLTLILLDSHVSVSLPGALVPFTAGYRPFALGLGTMAATLFLLVIVTGFMRGRLAASPRTADLWRTVHRAAYIGWVPAISHGILAGTDTRTPWAIAVYGTCLVAVAGAVYARLGRADRRDDHPLLRARAGQSNARRAPVGRRP